MEDDVRKAKEAKVYPSPKANWRPDIFATESPIGHPPDAIPHTLVSPPEKEIAFALSASMSSDSPSAAFALLQYPSSQVKILKKGKIIILELTPNTITQKGAQDTHILSRMLNWFMSINKFPYVYNAQLIYVCKLESSLTSLEYFHRGHSWKQGKGI